MRLGIFGGTFAPVHNGHVNIADCALKQLNLDKLIVLPCCIPPHKDCFVDASDRFRMTQLAFKSKRNVEVSNFELERGGKSYSFETLTEFQNRFPQAEIFFIIGADSLRDFALWKNPKTIADIATLAVADREDCDLKRDVEAVKNKFTARIVLLNLPRFDASSTKIRVNYQFKIDNTGLIPHEVDEYIKTKGLFCDFADKIEKLKLLLEPKRFAHTVSVVAAGQEFARGNGIDWRRAFEGCLLHDCAKNLTREKWREYGFVNREKLLPTILHCGLGVQVARREFGVTDIDVLNAIRYHTTGRPNMTPLEKLVFVADKAEKTRKYNTDIYFKTAQKNLDKAFEMVLKDMYAIAVKKYGEENVDGLTVATMKYYKYI